MVYRSEGIDLETIEYWNEYSTRAIYRLRDTTVWEFKTLESYREEAVISADSSALRLYAPDLLYKQSQRSITDSEVLSVDRTYALYFVQLESLP